MASEYFIMYLNSDATTALSGIIMVAQQFKVVTELYRKPRCPVFNSHWQCFTLPDTCGLWLVAGTQCIYLQQWVQIDLALNRFLAKTHRNKTPTSGSST